MKCGFCGKDTNIWTASMFCTKDICMECKEKEKRHPLYEEARRAEHEAVKNGNYNFEGIGRPADL